jgi:hypothetical protein
MIDKARFFAAIPPLRREEVKLPNGDSIWVRQLTVGERDRVELALSQQGKGLEGVRAHMLIAAVVDEQGEPIFQPSDYDDLRGLPAAYVEPIFEKIQEFNRFTDDDVEALAGESEAGR